MSKTGSFFAGLVVVLIPAVNWGCNAIQMHRLAWLLTLALFLVFAAILGQSVIGRMTGILIDNRNVMSLSRFQMVVWTLMIISAYITAAFYNIFIGIDEPLAIGIPSDLWMAMGISTMSLVGTPLILSQKTKKAPDPTTFQETKDQLVAAGMDFNEIKNDGQVIRNSSPNLASLSDMLTGDETSNGAHVDLAKVQAFFFTLVITVSYGFVLWRMFTYAQPDGLNAFPVLDKSAVALLGISHVGYLSSKAVPRS